MGICVKWCLMLRPFNFHDMFLNYIKNMFYKIRSMKVSEMKNKWGENNLPTFSARINISPAQCLFQPSLLKILHLTRFWSFSEIYIIHFENISLINTFLSKNYIITGNKCVISMKKKMFLYHWEWFKFEFSHFFV